METLIFLLFAALALASALMVVLHRNPVYATMSLVVTLFSVAVFFVMLGAPFLGTIQVLVYAGAIVVLFLFVIMLLNVEREEIQRSGQTAQRWVSIAGAIVFGAVLIIMFWQGGPTETGELTPEMVSMKGLATALFSEYLLAFEAVGLLLLVAVIGATVAARRPQYADAAPAAHASDAPVGEEREV
ncbi:MAG TPA: NADH-quinone oxidoreductase subunit J [Thermoanaerobaculia bacterium]|nr:NADH-quinone oxidoreductase subunit J [Thermoanaerobaculia bacterium]